MAILAITEDAEVKDLLLEMALSDGFGVRCATTEAEAAKLLHRERPGLLLVNLDMNGRAGLKFMRTLRQSHYRDIACVAVTASEQSHAVRRRRRPRVLQAGPGRTGRRGPAAVRGPLH